MRIEFSKNDVQKIIYDAFCNGGLEQLKYASVGIDWDLPSNSDNYSNSKKRLLEKGITDICREDIYMEILTNGDCITFTDFEADEIINMNLDDAISNLNSLDDAEQLELAELLNEDCTADACDYYNAIQYALYCEVIFG